jgi:hypothetical protein
MPDLVTDLADRLVYLAIIPFVADDDQTARERAARYAEELLREHGEVDAFFAAIKRPGGTAEPLYCGHADDIDICVQRPGHVADHLPRRITLVGS